MIDSVRRILEGKGLKVATASTGLSDEYVSKGAVEATRSISEAQATEKPSLVTESSFDSRLQYPDAAHLEVIR